MPSLLAAIGDVIERHMIEIGFLAPADLPILGEAAERMKLAVGAREPGEGSGGGVGGEDGPVPQLRRGGADPSGRLRHLPELRLFPLWISESARRYYGQWNAQDSIESPINSPAIALNWRLTRRL